MKQGKSAKKSMSREQAAELYRSLHKKLQDSPSQSSHSSPLWKARLDSMKGALNGGRISKRFQFKGNSFAVSLVVFFALTKIALSAFEHFGVAEVEVADASVQITRQSDSLIKLPVSSKFSEVEIEVLSSLDNRRSQLEARASRLDEREAMLSKQEMELAGRLNDVRLLTERLKADRGQVDRRREGQIEQLSKVYTSMAPEEAAHLMEQLDISIALDLIQRMPDKRIAQILALMDPQRALTVTKLLSGMK